jgi:hypothetical protein
MMIDQFAPRYDFVRTSHLVVEADPTATYRAVRELDLAGVHSPLVTVSMWARGIPERLRSWRNPPVRLPTRMTLDDLAAASDWEILGEHAGAEIAFGAIGKFWQPVIEWRSFEARDFVDFVEPGYGKIACSLSVVPYGRNRTLLTYDVRTILNDPNSLVRFRRYWRLINPFVGAIERAVLRTTASIAER